MTTPGQPFEIPDFLSQAIENRLIELGTNLNDSKFLATQIKKLSDFYIANPKTETPDWAEIPSLVYYFPLNYLRNLKVFQEASRLGFLHDLDSTIEFGAGLGPSSWALKSAEALNNIGKKFDNYFWIEKLANTKIYADLFEKKFQEKLNFHANVDENVLNKLNSKKTLAVFSYSLTELSRLPDWAEKLEALIILEPSTQEDGRRLQELRTQLIQKGFSIWGPCVHEQACPLLIHSKKDWCHDRLLLRRPLWLEKIENHLAWENKSLTLSYLLARKTAPPWKGQNLQNKARVIGDTLYEKGKTRQLICKDQDRLFFSWLQKSSIAPHLARGSLVSWSDHELKSNEVRPQGEIKYIQTPEEN